jgi:hypothetical protein
LRGGKLEGLSGDQTDHEAQKQRSPSHLNRLPLKGWTTALASSRQTQTILLRRFHFRQG